MKKYRIACQVKRLMIKEMHFEGEKRKEKLSKLLEREMQSIPKEETPNI